ncbi:MAG: hypothetical protein PVG78_14570 [Desulfobacterales bacterium]|jgi:hypothetical protein
MDSPLVRTILAALGGYLLILLILFSLDWYREEFPKPQGETPDNDPIHQAVVRTEAADAMGRYSRLAETERKKIRQP